MVDENNLKVFLNTHTTPFRLFSVPVFLVGKFWTFLNNSSETAIFRTINSQFPYVIECIFVMIDHEDIVHHNAVDLESGWRKWFLKNWLFYWFRKYFRKIIGSLYLIKKYSVELRRPWTRSDRERKTIGYDIVKVVSYNTSSASK